MSEPNRGLVGAGGSLARKIRSAAPSGNKLALWLVFFAGAITVIKKASPGSVPDYAVYFGISLGIAALLYEMTASKDMIRAWWKGRAGSMLASGAIWFCAFAFSINNWIGAASENQVEKSNLHKTALMETQAVTAAEAEAADNLKRLKDERNLMKPAQSVAAARAVVQTSEAHRWFTGATEGCKVTKGPQTREFCAKYFSAVADVALWGDIAKQEIAIGDAEAKLQDARGKRSGMKIETSEVRGDNVLLVRYGGFNVADAETLQSLIAVVVVSILLSFGSMRAEFEELAKHGERTPFNWGLKFRRWFMTTVYGREPQDVKVFVERTVEHHEAPPLKTVTKKIVDLAREQGLAAA